MMFFNKNTFFLKKSEKKFDNMMKEVLPLRRFLKEAKRKPFWPVV